MIDIYDVFTTRGGGVRTQTFPAGGRLGLHMRFRSSGLPPATEIRAFFVAEYIEQIAGSHLGVFRPWYIVSGDLTIDNGDYLAGIEWELPAASPIPTSIDEGTARRLVNETWRMRSWDGTWEFKALIGVMTPGVGDGAIAFSRDRWVYTIGY